MPNKFKIGDKVTIKRIDDRTPKGLLANLHLRNPRTIVATFFDNKTQHTRYYLGTNKQGDIDISHIGFRACQLDHYRKGKVGKPREKRRYRLRSDKIKKLGLPV